jgi:hypothetical protein
MTRAAHHVLGRLFSVGTCPLYTKAERKFARELLASQPFVHVQERDFGGRDLPVLTVSAVIYLGRSTYPYNRRREEADSLNR